MTQRDSSALQTLPRDTILNGRYLVESCIGSGGFGITYRAVILPDKAVTVAIKEYFPRAVVERGERNRVLIRTDAARDFARWRENYEREYKLLATLRGNRAILNVRETFEENNTSYLVMDFIPGETLEARVRNGGVLSADAALSMLYAFLPEIAKMHHAGILHRDINPGNIMLPPGGMPKLIDFGSARPVPREGGRLTSLLRPGYAPPEQYRERSRQGPESDVYALCACLYFALTGITPPDARVRAVNDELKPIAKLCALPDGLAKAITQGLNPDQKSRPASFEALWQIIFGDIKRDAAPRQRQKRAEPVKPATPVEHVTPVPIGDREKPESYVPSLTFSQRLSAARRAAERLRVFNKKKYAGVLDALNRMAASVEPAPVQRLRLEDFIFTQGRAYWLLTAWLTRKGT